MNFTFNALEIDGAFEIIGKKRHDDRGFFLKTMHADEYKSAGLLLDFNEEYCSKSEKNVLRGMHFQTPPHEHRKLIYCAQGEILDVLLDLRKNSKTYGKFASINVTDSKNNLVYIPAGVAHGFYTLSSTAFIISKTSSVHNPDSDHGILWSSFGFEWPSESPILSSRDKEHPELSTFKSPF